jgi:trehalose 6-phosphate synthase
MSSPFSLNAMPADHGSMSDPMGRCEELRTQLLTDWNLIIAANRGPVTFEETETGDLQSQRGKGGLVTALIGLCQYASHVTWIACALSEADAAWQKGGAPPLDDLADLDLQFLITERAVYEKYNNIIANPLLWFLQHSMWDTPRTPVINRTIWEAWTSGYVVVNEAFAKVIAEQILNTPGTTLVMLQDYHLYLVARHLRKLLNREKRPIISHFIHIPWPGPEYWRILPPAMRHAILEGLCAVDILGFQTKEDGLNFLRTCESYLPRASVKFKNGRVWYQNHATIVRDFPISINVEALRLVAESEEVAAYRAEIQALKGGQQLIARVDRIEPSKNIVRGFNAFEEMLEIYPEHRGRVVFLALLVPSRLVVEEYKRYLDEIMAAAGAINARFGTGDWEPVRVLVGQNFPRAVATFQLYDVLLVNSIADGMNLVAKEGPIANQCDGVLILSEGTGARQQLEPGALIISPFDVYATAQALHHGLTMPADERQTRLERLRWIVEREDISLWLCNQLEVVAELSEQKRRM